MSAAERLPSRESLPKPPTERPSLRLIRASDIHRGLEHSNVRVDRLRQMFTELPANDDGLEVVELSQDDLEEIQVERTEAAEQTDAQGEELRREYEAEHERSRQLADRYTEAMTKLMKAQSELETLNVERSIIGVRRFFDTEAKTKYADLEVSLQQSSQQLGEANRELRALSPLMQANNQRLDQLEQQKMQVESTVESQKRALVDGVAKKQEEGLNEAKMQSLREALKENLAASEALFAEIQEEEKAGAPLTERLSQLFQEQYQLDQDRKRMDDVERPSLLRRMLPWGRNAISLQRADLERRAKLVQREMAQTLQLVGQSSAKLEKQYTRKDELDRVFFRLNQEMNELE